MYPDQVRRTVVVVGLLAVAALLVACGANDSPAASSATTAAATSATAPPVSGATETSAPADPSFPAGTQHLHFEFGPVDVQPGQNSIEYSKGKIPKPDADGWILGCRRTSSGRTAPFRRSTSSTCTTACGSTRRDQTRRSRRSPSASSPPARRRRRPSSRPATATRTARPTAGSSTTCSTTSRRRARRSGSPTTSTSFPRPHRPQQTSSARIRSGSTCRTAAGTRCSTSSRARAPNGTFTYPDQATDPYLGGPPKNVWTVDTDGVLIGTVGHLHPGGLHDDLYLDRNGQDRAPVRVRSEVLRARGRGVVGRLDDRDQPDDWASRCSRATRSASRRPTTRRGRRGTSRWGSWSCGWPTARRAAPTRSRHRSTSPATSPTATCPRTTTTAGKDATLPDVTALPTAPRDRPHPHRDVLLRAGRHAHWWHAPDREGRATAHVQQRRRSRRPGHLALDHRVQGAVQPRDRHRVPARRRRHPVRLGPARHARRAHHRHIDWTTPTTCLAGTYTYFCRIHPFMRGAFVVTQA